MHVGGKVSQGNSVSDYSQKLSLDRVMMWWEVCSVGRLGWGALTLKAVQWWMGPLAISQPKEHCQSCFVCPLLWDWIAGRRKAVRAFQRREVNTLERRTVVESCCCPYLSLGWVGRGKVHQIWKGDGLWKALERKNPWFKRQWEKKILGRVVGRGDRVKDSRVEGRESRESRRNLANMKRMWAMWPDHLGSTAVAKGGGYRKKMLPSLIS